MSNFYPFDMGLIEVEDCHHLTRFAQENHPIFRGHSMDDMMGTIGLREREYPDVTVRFYTLGEAFCCLFIKFTSMLSETTGFSGEVSDMNVPSGA